MNNMFSESYIAACLENLQGYDLGETPLIRSRGLLAPVTKLKRRRKDRL